MTSATVPIVRPATMDYLKYITQIPAKANGFAIYAMLMMSAPRVRTEASMVRAKISFVSIALN